MKGLLDVLLPVSAVASVIPLWATRHLPLVDYPVHASTAAVLAAYGQDESIRSFYEVDLAVPYILVYLPWVLLAKSGLGVLEAGRVLLALSILSVPLGFATFLRERRRSPGVVVFAFAAAFGTCFRWGFVPNQAAIGLTFLGLAAHARWLRRPGLWSGLATAAMGLLIAGTHAIPLGVWGLVCGVLSLFQRGGPLTMLRSMLPLLPAGILLLGWTLGSDFAAAVGDGAEVRRLTTTYARERLLPRVVMGGLSDDHGHFAYQMSRVARIHAILSVVTWVAGLFAVGRVAGRRLSPRNEGWDLGVLSACGVLWLLYRETPDETAHVFFLWERLGVFIFLLGLSSLPHLRVRILRRLLQVLALVLTIRMEWQLMEDIGSWGEQHEEQLQQMIDEARPGEVMVAVLGDDAKHALRDSRLWHIAHWSMVERAALVPFGTNPYYPVQVRDGPGAVREVLMEVRNPELDLIHTAGALPEVLLVAGSPQADPVLQVQGRPHRFHLSRVLEDFSLYRIEEAR